MHRKKLTLGTGVEQHLRNETKQEVLEEAGGELEVGPVVTVLEALKSIALEVNLAIEVLLVEDNHGDLALSAVSSAVMLAVELQVVLDGKTTVLGLLSLARRDRRSDSPESDQDRNTSEEGEEDSGVETSTNLACQPPGDNHKQSDQQDIGEAVTAGRVGRDRSVLD